jgi:hypothetical protein
MRPISGYSPKAGNVSAVHGRLSSPVWTASTRMFSVNVRPEPGTRTARLRISQVGQVTPPPRHVVRHRRALARFNSRRHRSSGVGRVGPDARHNARHEKWNRWEPARGCGRCLRQETRREAEAPRLSIYYN